MQPVLIIGSGFIGATMAIALARAGIPVDLIEAKPRAEQLTPEFDGRTLAIAAGSVKILESLDVWQTIPEACPITDIRVCDDGGKFHVHYDHKEAGNEPFGYIVETRLLREALFNAVDATQGITLHEPCKLERYETDASGVHATLSDGTQLHAQLMLVADGKFSQTRAMAGIEPKISHYGQTAIRQ